MGGQTVDTREKVWCGEGQISLTFLFDLLNNRKSEQAHGSTVTDEGPIFDLAAFDLDGRSDFEIGQIDGVVA
jgi:hypothetical protein